MLNADQIKLLIHLKQYGVADKATCNIFVTDNGLRPLLRYKYISYNNWVYRLLKKGFEATAHIYPLVTVSGNAGVIERILKTSRLAALFANMGIQSAGVLRDNVFIPSNKWREVRNGITSTARFNGILCYEDMRLAVYNIGNGRDYEWQLYAEGSLFFRKYGPSETRATGMLLICDRNPLGVAEQILRNTMANRKRLMKRTKLETDKKWSYSTGPIRLRPNYEQVFITDKSGIAETLRMASNEQKFKEYFLERLNGEEGYRGECDIEVYPARYFLNPQGDLLKFSKCFDTVKSDVKFQESEFARDYHANKIQYHLIFSKKFEKLARMYDLPLEYTAVEDDLIGEIMDGTDIEEY